MSRYRKCDTHTHTHDYSFLFFWFSKIATKHYISDGRRLAPGGWEKCLENEGVFRMSEHISKFYKTVFLQKKIIELIFKFGNSFERLCREN